jgi:hypothetical protein
MKKFFSIVSLAVLAVVIALNMNAGLKSDTESDVMLDNVEALVQGETSGQFAAIGCVCDDSKRCHATNGNTYTYAKNN